MSVVLDASAAVDLVLGRPELTPLLGGQDIHVPAHFDVEVVGALRGLWWRRVIDEPTAERARADLARLAVVRYPAPALVDRAWDWRHDITIPDGAYVALAEILACPLLTTDERLARVAQCHVDVLAPGLPPPGPAR